MENETRDWETNPHLYLQNEDGNFVLKKDGTPKKKAGRPQTTTEKAIRAARSTVGRKKRNIQKLEQKLNNARQSFNVKGASIIVSSTRGSFSLDEFISYSTHYAIACPAVKP